MTGTKHARLDLGTVICLTVVILLHYDQRDRLNLLVCGKTLVTFITHSSSPDGIILLGRS